MSFSLGATVGATAMVFIAGGQLRLGFALGIAGGACCSARCVTGLQGFVIGWVRANPIIVSIAALALIYGVAKALTRKAHDLCRSGQPAMASRARSLGMPIEFIAVPARRPRSGSSSFGSRGSGATCSWSEASLPRRRGGRRRDLADRHRRLCLGRPVHRRCRHHARRCATIRPTWSYGVGYDYDAIAAVLVGGTAIQGGRGRCCARWPARWSSASCR